MKVSEEVCEWDALYVRVGTLVQLWELVMEGDADWLPVPLSESDGLGDGGEHVSEVRDGLAVVDRELDWEGDQLGDPLGALGLQDRLSDVLEVGLKLPVVVGVAVELNDSDTLGLWEGDGDKVIEEEGLGETV